MMRIMKQHGFTLVELMVSMTLSLLLVFIAGSVYLSNKTSFRTQDQLARLQESGRFSNYYLSRELRNAGYQGCTNNDLVTLTSWITTPPAGFSDTNAIRGYDGLASSFSPTLPVAITGSPIAGSDVIAIHTTSTITLYLNTDMSASTDTLSVANTGNIFTPGAAVLISNCNVADLFFASSGTNSTTITHTTDFNTANTLSVPYLIGSEVLPYYYYAYYIQNTGRLNTLGQPIYALVREDTNHNINEVAEGVEAIKASYLVDTDSVSGPNAYQTATQIEAANNWAHVVGVQLSLLLGTIESATKTPQAYYFNGSTTTPTDRKLRRQWDIFIQIRSQGASS